MKPIRLTLTIELPPDGTPEREELSRTTIGELLGLAPRRPTIDPDPDPPVRPHRPDDRDEPPDVQAGDDDDAPAPPEDPDTPRDGRQLMGWIGKQPEARELQRIAASLSKQKGYGSLLVALDAMRARDVYQALKARPARRARRG